MRLFVVFATKLAIYSALAVIGVWLIIRGGSMRDGLGVLAAAIGG